MSESASIPISKQSIKFWLKSEIGFDNERI